MRAVALALALSAPLPALAQADVLPDQIAERPAAYKPVTEIEFDGRRVEATVVKPDGTIVLEPSRPTFPSFIVLRASFDPELDHSIALVR